MHYLRRTKITMRIWRRIKQVARIIKNVLIFFIIVITLIYFGVLGWLYWEISRIPQVLADSVLVMNMEGIIRERPIMDPVSLRITGEAGKNRRAIINNIRKASKDPRIVGILVKMGSYGMPSPTAFEIYEELIKFKESGKKVFAFMESAGLKTYLLVSGANKIYMPPSGDTSLVGLRIEVPFFKKMLDMIGIAPEFIAIGDYKTAPQVLTMDHLSDEYREVLNDQLDSYYNLYVAKIAAARKVSEEQVKAWIDAGLYNAPEAQQAGLVDELLYESQLERTLRKELGLDEKQDTSAEINTETQADQTTAQEHKEQENYETEEGEPELNTINNAQYTRVKVKVPGLYEEGKKIAVIYAEGTILTGESTPPASSNPVIGSDSMTALLSELAKDEEIKGIILRIDSGGGDGTASDIIRDALAEARKKKPVVVSMASVAASGGYMIAAPADVIVAHPLTVTGSIGVFGGKFSAKGLLELIRINVEMLQRGENAAIFTSTRTWTPEEAALIRQKIQAWYDFFVAKVAEGREMTVAAVDKVAQGRVWMGTKALEIGLVDKLGGLDTAVAVMKEKLEIPEDKDVELVEYPELKDPFDLLLERIRETRFPAKLPDDLQQLQQQLEELARLQHVRYFAWWPYRVVVN